MSKTSDDPAKYHRASVAMPMERKAIMDERMEQLGLKTVGELVAMFTLADGVVEALAPIAEKFQVKRKSAVNMTVVNKLKSMDPDDLKALLEAAGIEVKA